MSQDGTVVLGTNGRILMAAGNFVNRIISPAVHAERVYEIEVEKPMRGNEVERFASGLIELKDEKKPLLPAKLEPIEGLRYRCGSFRFRSHRKPVSAETSLLARFASFALAAHLFGMRSDP